MAPFDICPAPPHFFDSIREGLPRLWCLTQQDLARYAVETKDQFAESLKTWHVEVEVPPGFQREVWARIAAREGEREQSFLRQLMTTFSMGVARPVFAALVLILASLAGLAIAHVNARHANAKSWLAMETHYVASLDPYAHVTSE